MNVCKICRSKDLRNINAALLKRSSLRSIAEEYGVSESALFRHKSNHLKDSLERGLSKLQEKNDLSLATAQLELDHQEIVDSLDAFKALNFVVTELRELLETAKEGKLHLLSVKVLGELRNSYTVLISLLQQAESSYQAKLELLKLQNNEDLKEAEKIASEQIKILSLEELYCYKRLVNKLTYQNDDVIIKDRKIVLSNINIDNSGELEINNQSL